MKRLLLSLLTITLAALSMNAQSLSVADISELSTNMKARVAQVRDNNGELCALIEVAIPSVEGLTFDANKVVKSSFQNGIYSLFVPAGTKSIGYQHKDYLPGTIDLSGISIDGGSTYRVIMENNFSYSIKVVSIKEAQEDLQALKNSRRDMNGELCALVKVQLPGIDNMEFGDNVVGTVLLRNGVYNLYVPAGTKRISFSHEDYYPGYIDFEEAEVSIIGGTTYVVVLQPPYRPESAKVEEEQSNTKESNAVPIVADDLKTNLILTDTDIHSSLKKNMPTFFAMGSVGLPLADANRNVAWGGMVGFAQRFGAFVKSNYAGNVLTGQEIVYSSSNGYDYNLIEYSVFDVGAGLMMRVGKRFYPFVGLGYSFETEKKQLVDHYNGDDYPSIDNISYTLGDELFGTFGLVCKLGLFSAFVGLNASGLIIPEFGLGFAF